MIFEFGGRFLQIFVAYVVFLAIFSSSFLISNGWWIFPMVLYLGFFYLIECFYRFQDFDDALQIKETTERRINFYY